MALWSGTMSMWRPDFLRNPHVANSLLAHVYGVSGQKSEFAPSVFVAFTFGFEQRKCGPSGPSRPAGRPAGRAGPPSRPAVAHFPYLEFSKESIFQNPEKRGAAKPDVTQG